MTLSLYSKKMPIYTYTHTHTHTHTCVSVCVCVVLSKAEKHLPYGELFGTADCVTLQPKCRTNRGGYDGIQLLYNISSVP